MTMLTIHCRIMMPVYSTGHDEKTNEEPEIFMKFHLTIFFRNLTSRSLTLFVNCGHCLLKINQLPSSAVCKHKCRAKNSIWKGAADAKAAKAICY